MQKGLWNKGDLVLLLLLEGTLTALHEMFNIMLSNNKNPFHHDWFHLLLV